MYTYLAILKSNMGEIKTIVDSILFKNVGDEIDFGDGSTWTIVSIKALNTETYQVLEISQIYADLGIPFKA